MVYTSQFSGVALEMGFPISHQNAVLLSNVFLPSQFIEKLQNFTQVVVTSYTSITPNYGFSCSRIKQGEGNSNTTTLVYNEFLAYTAVTADVDMPLPSFKMKSR